MTTQAIGPERRFLSVAQIDSAVAATINLVAAVAGRRVRVYQVLLNTHASQLATFRDTTPATLLAQLSLGAGGGLVLDYSGMPWLETAVGQGLDLVLALAAQTSGTIWYTQIVEVAT